MKQAGGWLIASGVAVAIIALIVGPSVETTGEYGVPDRIFNLARAQYQSLAFSGGGLMFLAGSILLAVGSLIERLEEAGVLKPVSQPAPPPAYDVTRSACEWCNRILGPGQRTCTEWPAEKLADAAPNVTDPICIHHLTAKGFRAVGTAPEG
jgi:hypothetical protein